MNPLENGTQPIECMHGSWDSQSVRQLKMAYQRVNIVKQIKKCFQEKTDVRMLEFGPGLGCLIEQVHSNWPKTEYHVADRDSGLLAELKVRYPHLITNLIAKSDDLEKIMGDFDVIAAVDVWEHLPLPLALSYTAWCWQKLSQGGMLILQTPNWGCPVTPATFCSDLTHCTAYNEESICHLFRSAGIPNGAFAVLPRRTPGFLGFIRDRLNDLFGLFYRLVFVFFGTGRMKIFSPDLIAIARK
jgi:2-polyprenyl-3-methyl-5-hydroxy-6-metoxy-1,4-benzoquinol methylase